MKEPSRLSHRGGESRLKPADKPEINGAPRRINITNTSCPSYYYRAAPNRRVQPSSDSSGAPRYDEQTVR